MICNCLLLFFLFLNFGNKNAQVYMRMQVKEDILVYYRHVSACGWSDINVCTIHVDEAPSLPVQRRNKKKQRGKEAHCNYQDISRNTHTRTLPCVGGGECAFYFLCYYRSQDNGHAIGCHGPNAIVLTSAQLGHFARSIVFRFRFTHILVFNLINCKRP